MQLYMEHGIVHCSTVIEAVVPRIEVDNCVYSSVTALRVHGVKRRDELSLAKVTCPPACKAGLAGV